MCTIPFSYILFVNSCYILFVNQVHFSATQFSPYFRTFKNLDAFLFLLPLKYCFLKSHFMHQDKSWSLRRFSSVPCISSPNPDRLAFTHRGGAWPASPQYARLC